MRSYTEARALIGLKVEASVTNGRTKKLTFREREDGAVEAVLFATPVVTFRPDRVEIRTGGYVTPTTFDGICAALNLARIAAGTTKRVPPVAGHRMTEGMALSYDGELIESGPTETPLAPARATRTW